MKRALAFMVLFGLTSIGQSETRKAVYMTAYDLDATSYTYCVTTGQNGSPFGMPNPGPKPILTSGSSTTVTAVTAGDEPFAEIAVGDTLIVNRDGVATDIVYVATRTDADNITVTTAVNWENGGAGRFFSWFDRTCGTAATNGWIHVGGRSATLGFQIDQMVVAGGSAGIYVRGECKVETASVSTVNIYPPPTGTGQCETGLFTSADDCAIWIEEPWEYCRIGFYIDTGDDAGDTGANAEDITAWILLR